MAPGGGGGGTRQYFKLRRHKMSQYIVAELDGAGHVTSWEKMCIRAGTRDPALVLGSLNSKHQSVRTLAFYKLWKAAEIPFQDHMRTSCDLGFNHSSQSAFTFSFFKRKGFQFLSVDTRPLGFPVLPISSDQEGLSAHGGGCRQGKLPKYSRFSPLALLFRFPPPMEDTIITKSFRCKGL